jgi:hypothetical protein
MPTTDPRLRILRSAIQRYPQGDKRKQGVCTNQFAEIWGQLSVAERCAWLGINNVSGFRVSGLLYLAAQHRANGILQLLVMHEPNEQSVYHKALTKIVTKGCKFLWPNACGKGAERVFTREPLHDTVFEWMLRHPIHISGPKRAFYTQQDTIETMRLLYQASRGKSLWTVAAVALLEECFDVSARRTQQPLRSHLQSSFNSIINFTPSHQETKESSDKTTPPEEVDIIVLDSSHHGKKRDRKAEDHQAKKRIRQEQDSRPPKTLKIKNGERTRISTAADLLVIRSDDSVRFRAGACWGLPSAMSRDHGQNGSWVASVTGKVTAKTMAY